MLSDEYNNLYTFIQGLIDNKIEEYDFLQKFLKRIQSKDSWKNYTIEPSIRNIVGGKFFEEVFEQLPPTISKAVSHNNSFDTYFYDDIYDKWYGIVPYVRPDLFALGHRGPTNSKQFMLLEFQ